MEEAKKIKKYKKFKSLKYPFGFDKNEEIFYPWVWDKVQKKKLPNDKIQTGNKCNLTYKNVKLSYAKNSETPHFKSQKGENINQENQASINMSASHYLTQLLVQKKKEVPIPSTQRYLINQNILNNWLYDGHKIFHRKNKAKEYYNFKEFILEQTKFNEQKDYKHNLLEIDYGGEYFGIHSIEINISGANLIDNAVNHDLIKNKLTHDQEVTSFRKKVFDIVAYDINIEPILIIEIIVNSDITEEKYELMKMIDIPSIKVNIKELDPYDPETAYPLTHDNSSWVHNPKFENEINLLSQIAQIQLAKNYEIYLKEQKEKLSLLFIPEVQDYTNLASQITEVIQIKEQSLEPTFQPTVDRAKLSIFQRLISFLKYNWFKIRW
ncbi:hypothetical protein [Rickettsiales endosymbiont of Stachyamoeba lipophora]|uniref:hypothetical protein n=1 Tax=Rickettsiales endosymbiont of Stachyamoeba lipophora TaxID=2486578 RepID=UPI000F64B555|nr:hypothetical protein [Rickettsiales endosymbiont of Stachyamoeba lipophora]AZL15901.1 hypothetical protein EF513_05005 [Rickettsiales endosymbiont of Stachyamoeba lipophora]